MNPMPPAPDEDDVRLRRTGHTILVTVAVIAGVVFVAYVAFFILVAVAMSNYGSNK